MWVDSDGVGHPTSLFAASHKHVGLDAPGFCSRSHTKMVVLGSLQGCHGPGVATSGIVMRDLVD